VCFIHIDCALTCAQVEAMCPSQRVSSVFIKVKGGRSRREQLILQLGAGRLCRRSDCSSIIFATSTTSPRYENATLRTHDMPPVSWSYAEQQTQDSSSGRAASTGLSRRPNQVPS
jgi:hypothetical protein